MHDRDLEHPDISRVLRDGESSAKYPVCPECGEEADTFYKTRGVDEPLGCENCIYTVDAWDGFPAPTEGRLPKFYFTYGLSGQPFFGGWTVVEAPDERTACELFRAVHPDKEPGIMNCCSVYTEAEFKDTNMAGPCGNYRRFCHETITLRRYAAED